jgi:hypothetical protein
VGSIILLLIIAIVVFWWLGGFDFISMGKSAALKAHIRPVHQSPERHQLLQNLQSGQASSLTQIDALLLAQSLVGNETWPEAYRQKYPNNVSFSFLYANHLIRKAWLARGTGAASSVTPEGAESFFKCLAEAEVIFKDILVNEAVAEDCYAPLLLIHKGLGQSHEAAEFYRNRAPRAEKRLDFHLARMGQITPRWGGDMNELMKLARDLFACGGPMTAALAAAWFEYAFEEDVKDLMKCIEKAGEKEKLITAFKQLKKTPQVINDREGYLLALAHNCFAVMFYHCNDKKLTREALEKTSGFYTSYPWQFMSKDVGKVFFNTAVKCKVSSFD